MGGHQAKSEFIYTIPVPSTETPTSSPIYTHPKARPYLRVPHSTGAKTIYDVFAHSAEQYPASPCLGTQAKAADGTLGKYSWKTYSEVSGIIKNIGYGLESLGMTQRNSDGLSFFGLISKSREEWFISFLGCISQDIALVPMYDTANAETLQYIIELTELTGIACSNDKFDALFTLKRNGGIACLRLVIGFDGASDSEKTTAEELGVQLLSFEELVGLKESGELRLPTTESVYALCFTSGTTGTPKGAMLVHDNMISVITGGKLGGYEAQHSDIHLCYLPLGHGFEQMNSIIMMDAGGSIGYYGGDILKLREDLAELRPTLFASVPRIYNRFYDLIIQQFNLKKGLKKIMINRALASKMRNYSRKGALKSAIWDKFVFKKVRGLLGGRVRYMSTGSAPISPERLDFLRIVFGCPIVEGYGQTENCALALATSEGDTESGHVGGPIPTTELKLVDISEMNYLSTDKNELGEDMPRGEICLRGSSIFRGYYKSPELTAEVIDEEGWLHTGDVGIRLPHNGAFRIIDRKKNIFKLAQGEYVAPEKVEIAYSSSPFIAQIFVYGDSLQSFLVGIVVPDQEFVRKEWAAGNGLDPTSPWEEISENPKLKQDILKDMEIRANESNLFGFEKVKNIHLEGTMWTPENLLTPTQKLMRYQAKVKYSSVISALYSN